MEWNNPYKNMKELENKTMMDMQLISNIDTMEFGVGSSEKGNPTPVVKPRKKSMTSMYLKFFETAPDGKSRRCKFCKQSYSIATATGNLGRHLSHRHPGYDRQGDAGQQVPQPVPVTKKLQPQTKPPSLDFDHLNWLLVKWLIGANVPPSAMDEEFRLNTFKFLNFPVRISSREKLHEVTLEVFRSMREDVRASLEQVNSKISITLDFWTSCEQVFYMSIKGHWIDENWSLHNILLDVSHIPYPCGGSEIFQALMKVIKMFNLDKRIFSCTNNNSQAAIHACLALKEELDARKVPFFYMPCAAHTLNLIIEDCLKYPSLILSKVREFVFELNASAELGQEFRQLTAAYQEGSWKIPLDASGRWTGDFTMLDIVRKASNSMDAIISKHEETLGGRNMLLSSTEKSVMNTLHAYLEPFYKITTDLCSCKVPTAGLVLFFMDHVFEITSAFRDNCRHDWLKNAADDMAKRARSFSSQVYNLFTYMAAILDPRIKKELIPENLNTEKNLEEARGYFVRHYSTSQFPAAPNGYTTQDSEEAGSVSFAEEIVRKRRRATMGSATDELTQYLAEPPAPMATDVLEWWKLNSMRYPRLSCMARDYLAVQGTAVEPDKLFSSKGDDIQKQRFCLPHSSMQAVTCIHSWALNGYRFRFRSSEIDYEKLAEYTTSLDDAGTSSDKKPR